jgi:peptidyl-prolyl cis-trans isomerase C
MLTAVNGEVLDDAEIRQEAANMRPTYYESMPQGDPVALEMQLRDWARENVIERVLLRQEAARHGLTGEQLVEGIKGQVKPLKSSEAGDYYRKNKDQFWMPELIHVAHIVRNVDDKNDEETARAAIEKAKEELDQGADFAELADRQSDCAGNGGDLGWFPRGQMVPEFEEVVFAMRRGEVSGIFRSTFGFHIARVLDRRAEGIAGFAEVRERIEGMLMAEKQQHALETFIDALKAQARIEKRHESLLRS